MQYCYACGSKVSKFIYKEIMSPQLIKDWGLDKTQVKRRNLKESSFCPHCGCSARSRAIAEALVKTFHTKNYRSLDKWTRAQPKNFKVAEINYCGHLHQFLKHLPGLSLSQYSEETLRAKFFNLIKGINKEDITNLSYSDNSFDLVLHSEVIEHVPDPAKALSECLRVLKPGGICIFTFPVVYGRKTKNRQNLPALYHGSGESGNLVYWEFGDDFVMKQGIKTVLKKPALELYVYLLKKD